MAYRLWLCLVKLFTAEVKPCLDVCYEVYRSCPSFQPEESYGGYHVFECPKEQGIYKVYFINNDLDNFFILVFCCLFTFFLVCLHIYLTDAAYMLVLLSQLAVNQQLLQPFVECPKWYIILQSFGWYHVF